MGLKYWTAAIEACPRHYLHTQAPPAAWPPRDARALILIDGRALMWDVVLELYRVVRQPDVVGAVGALPPSRASVGAALLGDASVHADVKAELARLLTLGEPRVLEFAIARLVSYFRAHGLEPVAIFDRTGDPGAEELKTANAAQFDDRGRQNGRHTVERLLAGVVGGADFETVEENNYALSHSEPRLAAAETAVLDALAASSVAVFASQGEADLVFERLAARFTSPLTVLTADTDVLCVRSRGGWGALRVVRGNFLPWQELLQAGGGPSATGPPASPPSPPPQPASSAAAAFAAHEAAAAAVARAHPLRYITPARFAEFVASRVPGFVPSHLPELALLCGTDYTKDHPGQRDLRRVYGTRGAPLVQFLGAAAWVTATLRRAHVPGFPATEPRVQRLEDWLAASGRVVAPDLARGMAYSRLRFTGHVAPLEEDVDGASMPRELRAAGGDAAAAAVPPAERALWRALLLAPRARRGAAGGGGGAGPALLPVDALNALCTALRGSHIGRERFEAPLTSPDGVCSTSLLRPIFAAEQALFLPPPGVVDAIVDPHHRAAVRALLCRSPRGILLRAVFRGALADEDVELLLPVQPAPHLAGDGDVASALASEFADRVTLSSESADATGSRPPMRAVRRAALAPADPWPRDRDPDLDALLPLVGLRLGSDPTARDDAFAEITDAVARDDREGNRAPAAVEALYDPAVVQRAMLRRLPPLVRCDDDTDAHPGTRLLGAARDHARAGRLAAARRELALAVAGCTVRHVLSTAARAVERPGAGAAAVDLPTPAELYAWVATVALLVQEDAVERTGDGPTDAPAPLATLPPRPATTLSSMRQATVASLLQQTADAITEVAANLGICDHALQLRAPPPPPPSATATTAQTRAAAAATSGSALPLPPPPTHVPRNGALPAVTAALLFDGPRFLALYGLLVPVAPAAPTAGGFFEAYPSKGVEWHLDNTSGATVPTPSADLRAALRGAWRSCSPLRGATDDDVEAAAAQCAHVWRTACGGGLGVVARAAFATLAERCPPTRLYRTLPPPSTAARTGGGWPGGGGSPASAARGRGRGGVRGGASSPGVMWGGRDASGGSGGGGFVGNGVSRQAASGRGLGSPTGASAAPLAAARAVGGASASGFPSRGSAAGLGGGSPVGASAGHAQPSPTPVPAAADDNSPPDGSTPWSLQPGRWRARRGGAGAAGAGPASASGGFTGGASPPHR